MNSIQLAIGNDDFSNILRMHLVEAGFDVLPNDAYHRNFLSDLLELERPQMVILHDSFLPSEMESKEANEQELLQLLNLFRMKYNESMRFVVISEREKNDPFLRSLVAHNVLDIFTGRQIPTTLLISQLSESPKYTNVAKLGVGQLVGIVTEESTTTNEHENEENDESNSGTEVDNARTFTESFTKTKEFMNHFQKRMKKKNPSPMESEQDQEEIDEEEVVITEEQEVIEIEEPVILNADVIKTRIIGTVFIAITSLGANIGSTHTSILVASHLKRKGYKVALVEGNRSGDFNRLNELFGQSELNIDEPFVLHGLDHFTFSDAANLHQYFHQYQVVVMDLGNAHTSPWLSEFFRAQKRIVVASFADWKIALIGDFIKKHGKIPFHINVPFADDELLKDLHEIYEDNTFSGLPFHGKPYEEQTDSNAALDLLCEDLLGDMNTNKKKRKTLWLSLASVAAIAMVSVSLIYFV